MFRVTNREMGQHLCRYYTDPDTQTAKNSDGTASTWLFLPTDNRRRAQDFRHEGGVAH
jgi:hypothetical protein